MPLIMCTKFQTNQIILTLFSGVWDKNPSPVAEKVVKCRRQYSEVDMCQNCSFCDKSMKLCTMIVHEQGINFRFETTSEN